MDNGEIFLTKYSPQNVPGTKMFPADNRFKQACSALTTGQFVISCFVWLAGVECGCVHVAAIDKWGRRNRRKTSSNRIGSLKCLSNFNLARRASNNFLLMGTYLVFIKIWAMETRLGNVPAATFVFILIMIIPTSLSHRNSTVTSGWTMGSVMA